VRLHKYEKEAIDEQLASTDIEPDPALRKSRRRPELILLNMAEKMKRAKSERKKRCRTQRRPRVLAVHYNEGEELRNPQYVQKEKKISSGRLCST